MAVIGLMLLALVAVLLVVTGLPAWVVLIGVSLLGGGAGVAVGGIDAALLTALPGRIVGLLENDLLQALPLYVLMGALLNRLPLADTLFRAGTAILARSPAGPLVSALGLGALLAPMNGSVGASVATLSRVVQPRLVEHGVPPGQGLAVVCVASTLGVVVPPSLVLILLGDAVMRAHTEAANAAGRLVRIINTQDVFRGALGPALLFVVLSLVLAWWSGRRAPRSPPPVLTAGAWLVAGGTLAFVVGLLAAVAVGILYAVEAAAMGAAALLTLGVATRSLRSADLDAVLRDTMAVSGALFALFVGATTFTLVFRALGSDRLLDGVVAALPGGAMGAVTGVLAMIGASAFVLDAFEIIFVVVPVLMPPLLLRVPDAVWVSVLTLLALQTSFLIPPFGYAVMMARSSMGGRIVGRTLARALLPFLAAQALVLALTVSFPEIAHWAEPAATSPAAPAMSEEDALEQMRRMTMPQDDGE